jgi:hypothetical protein
MPDARCDPLLSTRPKPELELALTAWQLRQRLYQVAVVAAPGSFNAMLNIEDYSRINGFRFPKRGLLH